MKKLIKTNMKYCPCVILFIEKRRQNIFCGTSNIIKLVRYSFSASSEIIQLTFNLLMAFASAKKFKAERIVSDNSRERFYI